MLISLQILRALWMALRDRVAAMDELEMAAMRLRLRAPDEEIDKATQPYVIERHEVCPRGWGLHLLLWVGV